MKDIIVGIGVGMIALVGLGFSKACFRKSGELIKPAFAGVAASLSEGIGNAYDKQNEDSEEETE